VKTALCLFVESNRALTSQKTVIALCNAVNDSIEGRWYPSRVAAGARRGQSTVAALVSAEFYQPSSSCNYANIA